MQKCPIIKFVLIFVLLIGFYPVFAQTDSTNNADSTEVKTMQIAPDSMVVLPDTGSANVEPQQVYDPNVGIQPYGISLEGLSMRMITGQTSHVLNKKVLEFCVQHRFGFFSGGKEQFYGFDQSDVRLGFDYGLTKKITLGIGRSSMGKTYNGFIKAALFKQTAKFPLNITWLTDMSINGIKNNDVNLTPYYTTHRFKYFHQLILSRIIADRAVLTVAPSILHRNLVDSLKYPNDLFTVVFNARIKVSQGFNITGEYAYLANTAMRKLYTPCLGIGFEIYTSGHIFQIVFSNSNSMNEADSYAMANGHWNKGDFRMGFNIVRQF